MTAPSHSNRLRWIVTLVLAALVLDLVLIQPNHPAAVAWVALLLFPLELPAILLALLAFGQSRAGLIFRILLVAVLSTILVLKSADFVMFVSLNRGFNPVADLPLVGSFFDLIRGAIGPAASIGAMIAAVLVTQAVILVLWWACGTWARITVPSLGRSLAATAALVATAIMIADIGAKMGRWTLPFNYPGTAFTARVGVERVATARQTIADLRVFRAAAQNDPFANATGLFDLVDRDVLIIFVESYGRTSLDTPFYADTHLETLAAAETQLSALGLELSSTLMTSPTQGGQSWLAHSTFANGLWIDNQTSYRAALDSGRQTLFHLAADAGFHTAAVMPQITLHWPESETMGFETILAANDLGYQGTPFNWVTMPDQFTFAAMDRLLLANRTDTRPMFVQLATGSSHAPWVPVPDLLPWQDVGDGTIYNPIVATSDAPAIVWQDHDRVRAQYRMAVDYALQTVFAYAALHADNPPLMIVLGDHQAAGFVALDERAEVPMHLIGPKHLVDLLSDADFHPGLIPPATTRIRDMDQFRAYMLNALSSQPIADTGQ